MAAYSRSYPRPHSFPLVAQIVTAAALGLGAFLVFIIAWTLGYQLLYAGRIFPGVTVAGVDLSGLSPSDAALKLNQALTFPITGKIVFRDGGNVWIASPVELGMVFDASSSAQAAYRLGRNGNPFTSLGNQMRARKRGADVSPVIIFDQRLAYAYVNKVTLMLVVFFLSSTGLVRASSTSLPGDNLYPVKRTWEDIHLLFIFSDAKREGLEMEYENERVEEIGELLVEGRVEPVSFSGYVTAQTGDQWTVSGVPVLITAQTSMPSVPVLLSTAVTVYGMTTKNGYVEAQSVSVVPAGVPVPTPKPGDENESKNGQGGATDSSGDGETSTQSDQQGNHQSDGGDKQSDNGGDQGGETSGETGSGSTSGGDSGDSHDSQPGEKSKVTGAIQSINGSFWVVNGQTINVSAAELDGSFKVGDKVSVEGYVNANGVFMATKVSASDGDSGGSDDDHSSSDGSSGGTATPPPEDFH